MKGRFISTIDAADIASGEGIRVRDVSFGVLAALGGESIVASNTAAVPEPTTTLGFVAAGLGLSYLKRCRSKAK